MATEGGSTHYFAGGHNIMFYFMSILSFTQIFSQSVAFRFPNERCILFMAAYLIIEIKLQRYINWF